MENQINKDILVFIDKEISKINRKLPSPNYVGLFFKEKIPSNPLYKEYERLNEIKNYLIITKCLTKINQLNSKLILLFKRCDKNLDKIHKIEVQIIEQEWIIKHIITTNYGKHNSNF